MNQCVDVFLKAVLEKVKYKKMHPYLAEELNDHIELLKEEFLEEGLSEEQAYKRAVEQMGEPNIVGESLHKVHKPKVEWSILLLIAALISIGILTLMVYANQSNDYSFKRQIAFVILGCGVCLATYLMDYRHIERWSLALYTVGILLVLGTALFGIEVNGRRAWLSIGGVALQATSVAVPLITISFVGLTRKWMNKGLAGYVRLATCALFASLVCGSNQMMTGVLLLITCLCIFISYLFSAEFKGDRRRVGRSLIGGILLLAGGVVYTVVTVPYRLERIQAWINPNLDPNGSGGFINHLREICRGASWIGNGGLFAVTEGELWMPFGPSTKSEYIFSFILGNFGILMAACVLLGVGILIIRCFKSAPKINELYGRNLLYAISCYFTLQFIFNIGLNLGILPSGSAYLPFISYGGSNLVCDMALMGFFLGVYRRKDIMPAELLKVEEVREAGKIALRHKFFIIRDKKKVEEARKEERYGIAEKLMGRGMDDLTIIETTSLSSDEVQFLKEKLKTQ